MINLLHKFHVEDVDKLKATKTTTYSSRKTAYELLETMADGVTIPKLMLKLQNRLL